MTKTAEGIVLEKCIRTLKQLELQGKVRHFERMNVGMVRNMQGYLMKQGSKGMSDLIAFVPVDDIMWTMFFEVKRESGGIQSGSQKIFELKFKGFSNVIYEIITYAKQIKQTVENARRKSPNYGKLEDWELTWQPNENTNE
jgi:hypothetical protein